MGFRKVTNLRLHNHGAPPLLRLQLLRNQIIMLIKLLLRRPVTTTGSRDRHHDGVSGRIVSGEVTADNGVDAGVPKRERSFPGGPDNNGHFGAAQDTQLGRLLEQAGAPLGEGDLPVAYVFDFLDFDFLAALGGFGLLISIAVHSDDNAFGRRENRWGKLTWVWRRLSLN